MSLDEGIWDAVVVGAGPAGGVAAALLTERGWRVALVERAHWPRDKVCGGCLNAAAVRMLREMEMGDVLRGAGVLDGLHLHAGTGSLSLELPGGRGISRRQLDERIVERAVRRGCAFYSGVSAKLLKGNGGAPFRHLMVSGAKGTALVRARLVLACDGISGTLLEEEEWARWWVAGAAWFGAAATLADEDGRRVAEALAPRGIIAMHLAPGGYAGAVRYGGADRGVHVAAAMSPEMCRQAGGPGRMVAAILGERGGAIAAALHAARFSGTGLLTRRRKALAGHRVLAVGDACGYVEPFTGEGIAWALAGAREAAGFLGEIGAPAAWPMDAAEMWCARHRAIIGRRQRWCRVLRHLIRRQALCQAVLAMAAVAPQLHAAAGALAQRVSAGSTMSRARSQGELL
jgi:flavin-dependent dehydrogenase